MHPPLEDFPVAGHPYRLPILNNAISRDEYVVMQMKEGNANLTYDSNDFYGDAIADLLTELVQCLRLWTSLLAVERA